MLQIFMYSISYFIDWIAVAIGNLTPSAVQIYVHNIIHTPGRNDDKKAIS
jgi:hypothetical protein